jgi:hypothetical protein
VVVPADETCVRNFRLAKDSFMADTRRAMHAITISAADPTLTAALLSADSDADAVYAFSLLRTTIPEEHLLMLANLRELLFELPEPPFRVGEDLELLARAGGYEDTGRSFRRRFDSVNGVFGLEFLGRTKLCEGIVVHTPSSRQMLRGAEGYRLDEELVGLFVSERILLDALLDALALLGLPMSPAIYVTADDFLAEHGAEAAAKAFGELF